MKSKIFKLSLTLWAIVPAVAFAALDGVRGLLLQIKVLMNLIIPIVFGLALVYFFWGVAQFILRDAGNDKTREDGKKKIMWGIIALFIIMSIYGILNTMSSLIGLSGTTGVGSGAGGVDSGCTVYENGIIVGC